MASIEYKADTLDATLAAVAAVAAVMNDMTPVMEAIGALPLVSARDRMRDGNSLTAPHLLHASNPPWLGMPTRVGFRPEG